MIIGIDGNEANVNEQVGVSVYTLNILNHFQQIATESVRFTVYLRNPPKDFLPQETEYFKYTLVNGRVLWSQVFLPLHLNLKRGIDIFFSPAHYSPRFCPVPLTVTIHDLSYFYYPDEFLKKDLYKLKNWTQYSIENAKHIIAVSKNTKKDILKFYPHIPEKKITVVYNGFEKNIIGTGRNLSLQQYNLQPNRYLLYVGTLQPRKNISTLLKSFAQYSKQDEKMQLVLVGKKGWMYNEIFKQVGEYNLQERVIFTGYIPDNELAVLYKNAFCYILPSFYEGFGIPILEAMSYGCPVISSFTSSLPEIGGNACEYFDPSSSETLTDRIIELQEAPDHRKELIKRGLDRVKEFSWEKCATETLKILQAQT